MTRGIDKLTEEAIAAATKPGLYGDGGNLYLQVADIDGKGPTKSWVLRYMLNGRARKMGLGSVNDRTLHQARERARWARLQLADGVDPLSVKYLVTPVAPGREPTASIQQTAKPKVARPTLTYFIQAGDANGLVKIGKTTDLETRIARLQTGCPLPLHVIRTISCDCESYMHRAFAGERQRGEWFEFCPSMLLLPDPATEAVWLQGDAWRETVDLLYGGPLGGGMSKLAINGARD